MLTVDVCLMLNCFLVEKFYLHYAVFDFDSILLHCTKLFIGQSIDREKNFDVTFEPPPPPPPIEKSCVRHCVNEESCTLSNASLQFSNHDLFRNELPRSVSPPFANNQNITK